MQENKLSEAKENVDRMLEEDHFSKWLGLRVLEVERGYCKLEYTLRKEMLNGFGMAHGGVLFSASDSAFAFASNSHGVISLALDASITFLKPGGEGEVLTVEAKEEHVGNRTGVYRIVTCNREGRKICIFNGTVYRTGKPILTEKTE